MRHSMLGKKPPGFSGPASVKENVYIKTINHPSYREANRLVHHAEGLLQNMGMHKEHARAWIRSWISGAGDGSE
jgi:hypothetical protein